MTKNVFLQNSGKHNVPVNRIHTGCEKTGGVLPIRHGALAQNANAWYGQGHASWSSVKVTDLLY